MSSTYITTSTETFHTAANSINSSNSVLNVYRYYNDYQTHEIVEAPPLNLRQGSSQGQSLHSQSSEQDSQESPNQHINYPASFHIPQLVSSQSIPPTQQGLPQLHLPQLNQLPRPLQLHQHSSSFQDNQLPAPLQLHRGSHSRASLGQSQNISPQAQNQKDENRQNHSHSSLSTTSQPAQLVQLSQLRHVQQNTSVNPRQVSQQVSPQFSQQDSPLATHHVTQLPHVAPQVLQEVPQLDAEQIVPQQEAEHLPRQSSQQLPQAPQEIPQEPQQLLQAAGQIPELKQLPQLPSQVPQSSKDLPQAKELPQAPKALPQLPSPQTQYAQIQQVQPQHLELSQPPQLQRDPDIQPLQLHRPLSQFSSPVRPSALSISPPPSAIPPLTPTGRTFQHNRVASNPFGVLYDPSLDVANASPSREAPLMNAIYQDIDNSITNNSITNRNASTRFLSLHLLNQRHLALLLNKRYLALLLNQQYLVLQLLNLHYLDPDLLNSLTLQLLQLSVHLPHHSEIFQLPIKRVENPIVTVIHPIRRTGSIVSTSASLRNRNRIKSRNKTISRTESIRSSASSAKEQKSSSWRDKIKFIFPVKRRTSLKYAKAQQQLPNFTTYEKFMDFIGSNYNAQTLKQSLPSKMNFFKYSRIIAPEPILNVEPGYVDVQDQDGELVITRKTFVGSPILVISPPKSPAKYTPLTELIYQKYKTAVFANKLMAAPRFSQLFPNDVYLLDKGELNQMNKKLLLEILLRRTAAAKIEYRLQQHGKFDLESNPLLSFSGSTEEYSKESSASGSPQADKHRTDLGDNQTHTGQREVQASQHSPATSVHESISTEELMKQNVSLYSGLLPSPQISYTSDMFGSIYSDDFKSKLKLLRKTEKPIKEGSEVMPVMNADTNLLPPIIPITKEPPANDLLCVNDFNRAYYEKYKVKEKKPESDLFSSNVYQLKPVQRSAATLSSSASSSSGMGGNLAIANTRDHEVTQATNPDKSSSEEPAESPHEKRISGPAKNQSSDTQRHSSFDVGYIQSGGQDMIFQNLDDLSSELSSFMDYDKGAASKKKRPSLSSIDETKLSIQPKSSSQIKLGSANLEVVNVAGKAPIKRGKIDIKSLQGSIGGSFSDE